MNKLTEKTVDILLPKILPLLNPTILDDVVALSYHKIVIDKHFHFIYSRMCKEFQQQCNTFLPKFMDKSIIVLQDKDESETKRKEQISVIMFLAELINDSVINYQTIVNTINMLIETQNIELLCSFYMQLKNPSFRVDKVQELLSSFCSNKTNPARIRFLAMDLLDHLKNNGTITINDDRNSVEINDTNSNIEDSDNKNVQSSVNSDIGEENVENIPAYVVFLIKWMKKIIADTRCNVHKHMEKFQAKEAFNVMHSFFYNEFSDTFLESLKPYLFQNNHYRNHRNIIFKHIKMLFIDSLTMVYPFYPILVEEIFNKFLVEQHEKEEQEEKEEKEEKKENKIFLYHYKEYRDNDKEYELISQDLSDSECVEFKSITDILNMIKTHSTNIMNRFVNGNGGENNKQIRKDKFNLYILCHTEIIYSLCVKFYDFIQILSECQDLSIQKESNDSKLDKNRYKKIGTVSDVEIYVEKILREDKVFRYPQRDNRAHSNSNHNPHHNQQHRNQQSQIKQSHQTHQQSHQTHQQYHQQSTNHQQNKSRENISVRNKQFNQVNERTERGERNERNERNERGERGERGENKYQKGNNRKRSNRDNRFNKQQK